MKLPSNIFLLSISLLLWNCAGSDDGMAEFQFESLSVDIPEPWLAHANAALVPANPLYSEKAAANLKSFPFGELKPNYSNMPEHIVVNFNKLPRFSGKERGFAPEIMIHSTDAYARILDPESKPSANFLAEFELIKKLSIKELNHKSGTPLPFVNSSADGSQHVTIGFKTLPFANGKGFRFVTAYAIEATLLYENSLVYIFQGITNDGKTYIMATFPVTLNGLPNYEDTEHLGFSMQPYPDFVMKQNAYNKKAEKWLVKNTDKMTPSLATLDAIMSSIKTD